MNEREGKFNTVLFLNEGRKGTQAFQPVMHEAQAGKPVSLFYPHTPKCRMASTMPVLAWLSAT